MNTDTQTRRRPPRNTFSVRMEDELKADLKQIARGQKRSLAKHIEFVLEQYAAQEKGKTSE